MKSVFIYDQLDADIQFFIKDGDYKHLDKLYLNCCTNDARLDEELSDMLYDDTGLILVELLETSQYLKKILLLYVLVLFLEENKMTITKFTDSDNNTCYMQYVELGDCFIVWTEELPTVRHTFLPDEVESYLDRGSWKRVS